MGGSRDFIGVGLFAVNVNLRKGGTEVMSSVAAFDLPLSCLFRGCHDPAGADRKSTRLNSSHNRESRMPSSA